MKATVTATTKRRINAPSHHRQRKPHTVSLVAMPPPPPELSGAASREWVRIGSRAVALGVMPDLDLQVFSAYCVAVGDLADVRAGWVLEGRPATVMRPSGQREHPTIQTLRTIGLDVLRYASALGLTPRSRKSLAVEIGAVETPPAAGKPRRPDPADKYFLDD